MHSFYLMPWKAFLLLLHTSNSPSYPRYHCIHLAWPRAKTLLCLLWCQVNYLIKQNWSINSCRVCSNVCVCVCVCVLSALLAELTIVGSAQQGKELIRHANNFHKCIERNGRECGRSYWCRLLATHHNVTHYHLISGAAWQPIVIESRGTNARTLQETMFNYQSWTEMREICKLLHSPRISFHRHNSKRQRPEPVRPKRRWNTTQCPPHWMR